MNPGYFSIAATVLKQQQKPMFLHISAAVWGTGDIQKQQDFVLKSQ